MCKKFSKGDLDVIDTTDPIGFKVRQVLPRIPAKLKYLHVVLPVMWTSPATVVGSSRTMLHRSLLTPL